MSDIDGDKTRSRIYRADVLKMITDNPGMIVYRDDIADKLDLTGEQVSSTVARLRAENNPIADEIEIAVPGRAWRYVPNHRVRIAARAVNKDIPVKGAKKSGRKADRTPLTESLRKYFRANPGRVIYVDELQEMMSTEDDPLDLSQVRVGVANARANHPTFRDELATISSGRAWRFTPLAQPVTQVKPETPVEAKVEHPVAVTTVPASSQSLAPSTGDADLLLLEKVGNLDDGSVLVRDGEKNLFRLYRM